MIKIKNETFKSHYRYLNTENLGFGTIKDVRDRSVIMECEVKFGANILPAYSPLDIKVKQQLQSGENASLYVIK